MVQKEDSQLLLVVLPNHMYDMYPWNIFKGKSHYRLHQKKMREVTHSPLTLSPTSPADQCLILISLKKNFFLLINRN